MGTTLSNAERMRDVSRVEMGQSRLEIRPARSAEALEYALQAAPAQIEAQAHICGECRGPRHRSTPTQHVWRRS